MEKYINIILPKRILESLGFTHSLTINRIGYYEELRNHFIERDRPEEAILLLCINGKGFVECGGDYHKIGQGDVALLPPCEAHRYGGNNADPWSILWAHFSGDGIPGLLELYREYGRQPIFHLENYQYAAEELHSIIRLLANHYNAVDIHKACCMLQLILLSFIGVQSRPSSTDSRYIGEAIRFMTENLYNNVDLPAVSRHLGITTFHTIRIFKSAFLTTPMQYYNSLRLNEAGRLLLHTEWSVAEISRRLGYSSPFYFSQQFKNKMGLSPSEYKKIMRCKY